MTGDELKAIQTRYGWNNRQAAEVLNGALHRNYTDDLVSKWRRGAQKVPKHVAAFLEGLDEPPPSPVTPGGGPSGEPDLTGIPEVDDIIRQAAAEDSAPSGLGVHAGGDDPERPRPQLTLVAGGPSAYAKICEEFFELIATGVGMVGAAVGSDNVRRDGQIILEDKAELGKAWGKLAEQNETFAKILTATDKQGAYLAVALATGTTVGKLWRNHQPPPPPRAVDETHHHSGNSDGDQREHVAAPPTV